MLELGVLGLAGVGQGCCGGEHRRFPPLEAETVQGRGLEVLLQDLGGAPALEQHAVLELGGARHLGGDPALDLLGQRPGLAQHLPRPQHGELLERLLCAAQAADEEGAGRHVEEGAGAGVLLAVPDQARQQVLFLALEQLRLGHRARGDDARDLASRYNGFEYRDLSGGYLLAPGTC